MPQNLPPDPTARVNQANAAAPMQPVRNGFINSMRVYPSSMGALSGLCRRRADHRHRASAREQLVGQSRRRRRQCAGSSATPRADRGQRARSYPGKAHPRRPDDKLVINTNMSHLSHGASIDREDLYGVGLLAVSARTSSLRCAVRTPGAGGPAGRERHRSSVNFRYDDRGDRAPWRPLRAFDDGRQVFIEFPRGIGQGEMPPLFVVGPGGQHL